MSNVDSAENTLITGVCISKNPVAIGIPGLPFVTYTKDWAPFDHEMTRERIEYLASRRNAAIESALVQYPDTEHILMIDSYYLNQGDVIGNLIERYEALSRNREMILGASVWILDKTHLFPRKRFYDYWTTPEIRYYPVPTFNSPTSRFFNTVLVRAVGGCYLFPRDAWRRVKYGVFEDLHGCEHNWLCEKSDLPVFLSLNERLWREPISYPILKRVRMSLNLGRVWS